jgi:hypothetical protein
MIDIFIDDMKCESINSIKEGYRINLKNDKQESLALILNEENFVDLYNRIKRRCETQGIIPIYNERG